MGKELSDFTGQYKLSETLSFELKPIGKTAEMLEKSGLLEQDQIRAGFYPGVKKKLDEEHKKLLERALSNIPRALETLAPNVKKNFTELLTADGANINWMVLFADHKALGTDGDLEGHKTLQSRFRTLLVEILKLDELYDVLTDTTPKKFFAACLKENAEKEESIATFARFACYFKGFQENRKNIYSTEPQATAAANRLINENFPKFYSALQIYQHVKENYSEIIASAATELAEQLAGRTLDSIFTPNYYSTLLAQPGIDDFNTLLGGITLKSGKKIRGINEFVNLYRQQHPEARADRNLAPISPLFKQILSDRESISFVPEMFQDDAGVLDAIRNYKAFIENFAIGEKKTSLASALQVLVSTIKKTDDHIYVAADKITQISQKLLGNWGAIAAAMGAYAEQHFTRKGDREKWLKRPYYALSELSQLKLTKNLPDNTVAERCITEYWTGNAECFSALEASSIAVVPVLNFAGSGKLRERDSDIEKIKAYLDAVQDVLHFMQPLNVENAPDPDANFYYVFNQIYNILDQVIPLYNQVRNYVTQKAVEVQKIKLMFGNPTLADGWDKNKERDNAAIILRRENNYFLGIMNPKAKTNFEELVDPNASDCYQKMVYKLLPGPNKTLPHVFFSAKGLAEYKPSSALLAKYTDGCYKRTNAKFDLKFCHELIDFFKMNIPKYGDWKTFNFQFSDTSSYAGIDEFYREISEQGYRLTFCNIPTEKIDGLIDSGKLYLFQIYNKDFASGSHGRPNKFTLYWHALFDPENMKRVIFKLNGEAELFLREPGLENPYSHRVGEKMVNRISRSRKPIPDAVFGELFDFVNHRRTELSADAAKLWDSGEVIVKDVKHEIIKDRRFTQRKYLFHVPITLNYLAADSTPAKFNQKVVDFLHNNPEIKIIGIDRGERNLIYLSLIDQSGKILQQKSFNLVGNMDYHAKLDQREKERNEARRSWKTIGKIKDLKAGYLSQVVHEIASLMVQEKAIVVLEDLNRGFKRGRFAIEKQVYQKFEKALIDKLNYLVFKGIEDWKQPGGVLNGYQLTSGFESFQKLGKQSGFLFYVDAAYTSKIDPTTGFVNLFKLRNLSNAQSRRDFLQKFKSICYDAMRQRFAFEFCYSDFNCCEKSWRDNWTVYSADSRLSFDPTDGKTKIVKPTQEIIDVLTSRGVALKDDWDLKAYLSTFTLANNSEIQCVNTVFYALDRSLQMRNSNADTGEDYIESPVLNAKGEFFRSSPDNKTLPQDADANGAYHIALKGLYLLQEKFSKEGKVDLKVERPDWLAFMQKRNQ